MGARGPLLGASAPARSADDDSRLRGDDRSVPRDRTVRRLCRKEPGQVSAWIGSGREDLAVGPVGEGNRSGGIAAAATKLPDRRLPRLAANAGNCRDEGGAGRRRSMVKRPPGRSPG